MNSLASFLQALTPPTAPQNLGKSPGAPDAGFEGTSSFADALSLEVATFPIEEPKEISSDVLVSIEETNKLEAGDLAEALEGLEEELESLGEEGVLLLLNFFHALESTGPVGIRVQGQEGSGAALPVEAEQAWNQLAIALQGMIKLEGAQSDNPELKGVTELSQLLSRLIDGLKKTEIKSVQVSSEAQKTVVTGSKELLKSSEPSDAKQDLEAQPKVQLSTQGQKSEKLETASPKKTEAEPEIKAEVKSAVNPKSGQGEAVKQTEVPKEAQSSESKDEETQLSEKKASSAVVVLRSVVDGVRSRVLKALDVALAKAPKASLQALSQKLFGSGDLDQLKGWLEKAVATAGESLSKSTLKLSATDALGFLNFVAQKRQIGWSKGNALTSDALVENSEAGGSKEKTSQKTKEEAPVGVFLKTTNLSKAELSYGVLASRRALSALPLPQQAGAAIDPLNIGGGSVEGSEDIAEVKVENIKPAQDKDPALDPTSVKQVAETERSSAKEAKAITGPTAHRFDQEMVDRVLTQTKHNLRIWMDRKLVAMEIQMEPAELGKMQMRTVLEQGQIGVLLQVENAAVKELIQQQLQDMRAVLEAQGLQVAGFYVEVWQREQGGAHGGGEKSSGPKFDLDRLLAEEGSDDDPKPPQKKSLIDQVA